MDHKESSCKYTGLDREYSVTDLAAFHGHLGPYIVLGYRIGRYARRCFCADPFRMKAAVFCQGVPPQSCLADGIQIGSGCTLGKRNIEIIPCEDVAIEFSSEDKRIVIRPKPFELSTDEVEDRELLIEKLALKMYSMPDSMLFSLDTGVDGSLLAESSSGREIPDKSASGESN